MIKLNIIIVMLFAAANLLFAGSRDTLTIKNNDIKIRALKLDEPILLDGKLDESIWQRAEKYDNFIQRDPEEGKPASQRTVVKVAYDESALYVAAVMFDEPDSIISRLSRRDEYVQTDRFTLFLDSYYDKRSGYYFSVTAAGSLIDGVLFNDGWDDNSWDGVWEAKVSHNDGGWITEMRIPFSQLRFKNGGGEMLWGVNFKRDIARNNERSYLVFVPKHETGFVSHFADLTGFENISAPGSLEIRPYLTTKAEYISHENGDPFNNGSEYSPSMGVDIKYSLGSNLTLNATINPDFGQVEIDPAVINLSDVESFFSERRPFFVEGSSTFNFGIGGANNYWGFNWSGADFFYSRRIGRTPQGGTPDADYVDYPSGTRILGAGKITGKLGDSWNIGSIQAVTRREFAEIDQSGSRSKWEVEPLTFYSIVRAQKEFNEGRQALGFITTGTIRDFDEDNLKSDINSSAYSFGIDGWSFLDAEKNWVFTGWAGLSHLTGTQSRITNLQRNSRHYFQRPDAKNISVDSSATSLTGYATRFYINKQRGNFFVNSAFGMISPSFDVNDVGFMFRADVINAHIGAGYVWNEPTDFYRSIELGAAAFTNHDFDGNPTWQGIFHFGWFQFLNYYSVNWNLAYNPETVNNRRTRGGPLTLNLPGYEARINAQSDSRNNWVVNAGAGTYQTEKSYSLNAFAGIEFRPLSNIMISVSPLLNRNFEYAQWVNSYSDINAAQTYGERYVFAEMDQTTISASIRLNWTFTPDLSLQLYMQPLISSGDYKNYKELKTPKSYDFLIYGTEGSTFNPLTYEADPDDDGPISAFKVDNRDYNFVSLRGNAVLRWEYLPGSVVYFVWTQSRAFSEEIGEFQFGNSFDRMFEATPDNIFMIKMTYWLNM
ncbi:MAG: DUF5916 domain-containing protein [Ignavibacteriaceae bacterium]